MNKIKILSLQEAQKIAAGEVVERPAHIVKELLENSIDAGASQISLYIEKAGKSLIRIVDNGSGMSPADAQICFLPHATSKVTRLDDLGTIKSFGFRGEALASIAAVSNVVLLTKLRDSAPDNVNALGIRIEYSESICKSTSDIVAQPGTDIAVKDLFFNIPARKKFLKQDITEWNQIQDIFYAVCLSHQNISFKLYHDNKLIINAPAVSSIKDRITQLWDHNFSQNLIPLVTEEKKQDYAQFTGMISNHQFWRYGRDAIYLFVNNRWVKNQELGKSILKGYLNVLPPGKFPAAFIFITLEQGHIDINVHPKKEEVRFTKPGVVEASLQTSVRMSLEQNLTQKLQVRKTYDQELGSISEQYLGDNNSWILNQVQDDKESAHQNRDGFPTLFARPIVQERGLIASRGIEGQVAVGSFPGARMDSFPAVRPPARPEERSVSRDGGPKVGVEGNDGTQHVLFNHDTKEQIFSKATIIGQALNTYIILESGSELVLIDQHAAHERVLYEEFLKNFEKKDGITLLFPDLVTLKPSQINAIMQEKEFFHDQGISLDLVSDNTLAIKSAPPKIHQQSLKELLLEAVSFIQEHETLERELFRKKLNEHVHSHMACKAAVKAGDVLTMQQMQQLITDLEKTEKRFICVHGRPTTWTIAQDSIEKNFRRK